MVVMMAVMVVLGIVVLPVNNGFIPIEPGKGKGEPWHAGSEGREVKILSEDDPPSFPFIQSCPPRWLKIYDIKPGGAKAYTHMELSTYAICHGPNDTFLCYRYDEEIAQLEFKGQLKGHWSVFRLYYWANAGRSVTLFQL